MILLLNKMRLIKPVPIIFANRIVATYSQSGYRGLG
jgi:hypothetical protein